MFKFCSPKRVLFFYSETQINNATGETQSTVVDLHVRALHRWIDCNEDACVKTLRDILILAHKNEVIDANVTEILKGKRDDGMLGEIDGSV